MCGRYALSDPTSRFEQQFVDPDDVDKLPRDITKLLVWYNICTSRLKYTHERSKSYIKSGSNHSGFNLTLSTNVCTLIRDTDRQTPCRDHLVYTARRLPLSPEYQTSPKQ